MKTKTLILPAAVVVVAAVAGLATFNQWHRYKEAMQSLAIVQRMTPGTSQIDEVKEAFGRNSMGKVNCPSGTCIFTKLFDNMWLERVVSRKTLIFAIEVSVEGGVVTNTSTSLKVASRDSWVGAAVLRSRYTSCKNPESSCTSLIIGGDRHVPSRIVSRLSADPLLEVKQPAYDFELKCLLPFRRCATIDDIYPDWKQLPDLLPAVTA